MTTDEATRAAARGVARRFQRYTSEHRADRAASHRLGPRQRTAVGEYFYTHPALPGLSFHSRGAAARAAVRGGYTVTATEETTS